MAAVGGLAVALAFVSPSVAELYYYDPFLLPDSDGDPITDPAEPALGEYNIALLAGQDPQVPSSPNPPSGPWGTDPTFFDGAWQVASPTQNTVRVREQGMSYVGAPALGGSIIVQPDEGAMNGDTSVGRNATPAVPWDDTTVGTYYMGFIINYGGLPEGATDMGFRAFNINQNPFGDGGNFLYLGYNAYFSAIGPLQQNPATARLFLGTDGPGGQSEIILEGSPLSFNEDGVNHLVVLRFDLTTDPISGLSGGDRVTVYLDPLSPIEPEIADAARGGMDITLGSISFNYFGGPVGPLPAFDEFRVGTSFLDVLPELPYPGDTDGDGDADLEDLDTILAFWGQTVTGGPGEGDVAAANGKQGSDNFVGLGDFALWKDWRTDGGAGGVAGPSGSAPEPSSWTLALCALLGLAGFSRRSA
jgi:hypothetical protein